MPDLTEVIAIDNNANREIEFDDSKIEAKTNTGQWIDITDGSFPERVDQRPSGGKKFIRLSVADVDGQYSQILATMTSVKINGREHKITDKDSPLGSTREWIIELQPI